MYDTIALLGFWDHLMNNYIEPPPPTTIGCGGGGDGRDGSLPGLPRVGATRFGALLPGYQFFRGASGDLWDFLGNL